MAMWLGLRRWPPGRLCGWNVGLMTESYCFARIATLVILF